MGSDSCFTNSEDKTSSVYQFHLELFITAVIYTFIKS